MITRLLAVQLILLFAIIPGRVIAQSDFGFVEGTIIKKDNSTIKCYVEFTISYDARVAYKMSQDGNEKTVKSIEVKSIQTPYQYFENITVDNKERLMAMVADGKVKLFSHVVRNPGKEEKMYGGTASFDRAPTITYALKKDDAYYEITKKDFKEQLSELLIDQPSIVEKINSKEAKFAGIDRIVNEYNEISRIHSLRRQVTARVIDAETKKPVKDAKVTIQGTNIDAITNFLGFVQITIDTVDTILVSHPEYETGWVKIPEVSSFQITLSRFNK